MEIAHVVEAERRAVGDHDPAAGYRLAGFSDLSAIAAIEAEVFHEPYLFLMLRQLFDLHGTDWLVADVGGEVAGYALLLEKDRRALLFTYAVAKAHQYHGYGEALLEHTKEHCRAKGVEVLYLTVRPDNLVAAKKFRQAGFQFTTYDETYFGEGEPREVYEIRF